MTDAPADQPRFVSRGGIKLHAALQAFQLDVAGFVCADLGANVGGFTDCLLFHGAAKVFAVDTGYGQLAWTLRNDPRVTVMERTNAMHVQPPARAIDLVTIDLAWTPQRHAIPAALRWAPRWIISLIKPHYEADLPPARRGVLDEAQAEAELTGALARMSDLGVEVISHLRSPIRGGKGKGRTGNIEYLALLRPDGPPSPEPWRQ
jgi:23S rRNA (cytidine1920-2'-O)/16S rRNA (cytidine1409-2'-O)-methyltransferase